MRGVRLWPEGLHRLEERVANNRKMRETDLIDVFMRVLREESHVGVLSLSRLLFSQVENEGRRAVSTSQG